MAAGASTAGRHLPGLRSWQLFAICVGIWGTTWHAITYQLDGTPPELGVTLRFGLAGAVVLAWCAWRGTSLQFGLRQHALFALQGVFLYSLSYVCVYHAEQHVPSGLVAVGYSASPLINGLAARALWGVPVTRRFVAGGLCGVAGVALIFAPEFGRASVGNAVALGALFTVGSVLLSSIGGLTASRNRAQGLPLWPALGFGMLYSGVSSALVLGLTVAAGGTALALPTAASWWAALLYLSLAGSVLAFACWLALQDRVGPGPSSAVGVAAPVLAIIVSVALEGYRPGWLTLAGVAFAVLGNVWMLVPRRP
ncbi:EamA family transporter [uncultured Methylibium sp.]|uniref:DMT family transporter n=1 Tax=uncultured Methylibium sp. TaxID=381093 RepID=UPI0025D99554|nr:EamA family transporter [uncultured Methylibium sp.]